MATICRFDNKKMKFSADHEQNCSDSLGNLATRNPWPVKLNTVGIFEGFLQFILATTLAFNHL